MTNPDAVQDIRVMNTPRSVDIAITNRCNLRCTYCSYYESPGESSEDLPLEEWLTFFRELNRLKVMEVTLHGGEPFCRQDILELLQGVRQNNMRFSILSNGTRITERIAAEIAKMNRCDMIQVSIDGPNSDIHDSFRGKGSFLRAVNGIRALQKYQVPVSVRVTIHQKNVHHLVDTARFLLEELHLPSFSTNAIMPLGRGREDGEQHQLGIDDRTLAMKTLVELNRHYKGRITAESGPMFDAWNWSAMEYARRKGRTIPNRGYLSGCSCPFERVTVLSDGTIVPCAQLAHIILGRMNKDDFKEVWQHHPGLQRLRRRRLIPLDSFEFCDDCPYIKCCTGNCPALAYSLVGDEQHPSPEACLKRFLEAGGKLPDLYTSA
jgi:SynChlorMet cassette radical SAM/SPASM protein ScmE